MTHWEMKRAIEAVYGSKPNPMTPIIEKYHKAGRFLCEVSRGRGLKNQPLWGLTVIEEAPDTPEGWKRTELSKCVASKDEVETFLGYLRDIDRKEHINV